MIHLATLIGARPQFIKAAALSNCIQHQFKDQIKESIIHSGQHYDHELSQIFFDELNIPKALYHINCGSGNQGWQTGTILEATEKILLELKPDALLVYGDTNTTLAGALAASKLHIPLIHVEAGLRSYNKNEPEEINRILTDHCATFLSCPTQHAMNNLMLEGIYPMADDVGSYSINQPMVLLTGDVMYDLFLKYEKQSISTNSVIEKLIQDKKEYILTTFHRAGNLNSAKSLNEILIAIDSITNKRDIHFVLPLHPGTVKALETRSDQTLLSKLKENQKVHIIAPMSYQENVRALLNSKMVMTDAGGLQKESYFAGKPCIVLREETEWLELIENNAAFLTGCNHQLIIDKVDELMIDYVPSRLKLYGNGDACTNICQGILNLLTN